MVHEIFIVEDKEKLIGRLKSEFKNHKEILLRHMPSRKIIRPFT